MKGILANFRPKWHIFVARAFLGYTCRSSEATASALIHLVQLLLEASQFPQDKRLFRYPLFHPTHQVIHFPDCYKVNDIHNISFNRKLQNDKVRQTYQHLVMRVRFAESRYEIAEQPLQCWPCTAHSPWISPFAPNLASRIPFCVASLSVNANSKEITIDHCT